MRVITNPPIQTRALIRHCKKWASCFTAVSQAVKSFLWNKYFKCCQMLVIQQNWLRFSVPGTAKNSRNSSITKFKLSWLCPTMLNPNLEKQIETLRKFLLIKSGRNSFPDELMHRLINFSSIKMSTFFIRSYTVHKKMAIKM